MERVTRQKSAIESVFVQASRPLSVNEVLKLAREAIPQIGIATVYRYLKDLQLQGKIVQVIVPGNQLVRFESASQKHHHHFYCRLCERVYEINKCLPELKKMAPKGFVAESHDITLFGRCQQCDERAC